MENISIDFSEPSVSIHKPPELIIPGRVLVNGSIIEYSSGSGIERYVIELNDEVKVDQVVEGHTVWFDWNFTAESGETYDLFITAYDKAGNVGRDRKQILVSERGLYEAGYIYLFENQKFGPLSLLENRDMAVVIANDIFYVVLPEFEDNTSSIEIVATQQFLVLTVSFGKGINPFGTRRGSCGHNRKLLLKRDC